MQSHNVGVVLQLCTCLRQVPNSNLSWAAEYVKKDFYSVKVGIEPNNRPQLPCFKGNAAELLFAMLLCYYATSRELRSRFLKRPLDFSISLILPALG
jgi:hypothetical protein